MVGLDLGFGSSKSKTTESSSSDTIESFDRGNVKVESLLRELMSGLDNTSVQDLQARSIASAEQDVSGVVGNIFSNFREQALPEIFTASESAGVFGSSGAQALTNDAFSRATRAASELTLGTATTRVNQQLQSRAQMQQFLSQLFGIDLEQDGSAKSSTKSKGVSRTKGSEVKAAFSVGGGGGGSKPRLIGGDD